ncbi:MAG: hypothetical protein ACLT2T_18290 [Bilophila wadsworthia]
MLPLLAARWVWAAAQFVQVRMFMERVDAAGVHLLGVSLFTAAPVAGRKTGDAWYARQEGRSADGGLFRTIAILTPLLFVAPQAFLTGALPGWARSISCLPGLGLVGGIAAGQGCRAAYALIHLAPVLGGLFRTAPAVLPDTACSWPGTFISPCRA